MQQSIVRSLKWTYKEWCRNEFQTRYKNEFNFVNTYINIWTEVNIPIHKKSSNETKYHIGPRINGIQPYKLCGRHMHVIHKIILQCTGVVVAKIWGWNNIWECIQPSLSSKKKNMFQNIPKPTKHININAINRWHVEDGLQHIVPHPDAASNSSSLNVRRFRPTSSSLCNIGMDSSSSTPIFLQIHYLIR